MSSYTRDPNNVARVRARRSLAQMPHRGAGIDIDKENVTTDLSAAQKHNNIPSRTFGKDKRSRSKSLGPGGLDLLKNGGNSRRKSTAAVQLKSILKPTIPVSPISQIPTFAETRRKTPNRDGFGNGYKTSGNNDLLIDFSTPTAAPVVGTDSLINPFDNFNPIPPSRAKDLAAQREREEQERIEREREKKKAILEQRAARRKSMANRRVSFAPEATLHTWNVVELMEDSTASSAANTTRRASSLATGNINQDSDASEPPSSPGKYDPEDVNRPHAAAELDDFVDEAFSSSPFSGGSTAENDGGFSAGNMDVESDSLSSGPEDESTNMSMDNALERSFSPGSDGSSPSSSSLERSLKRAAEVAGTRGIDFDENGELSMEFTNHEIVGAFQPWVKKGSSAKFDAEDLTSRFDQENIGSAKIASSDSRRVSTTNEDGGDMSMDITKPVGGIIRGGSNSAHVDGQDSRTYLPFQQNQKALRRSSAVTNLGDQTMEFTNVIGGIKSGSPRKFDTESNIDTDEEMTMEFTNVLGGVLNKQKLDNKNDSTPREEPNYGHDYEGDVTYPDLGEDDMEMTGAVGGILPPIEERTEPSDDGTMGMDMTNAVGKILAPFQVDNLKGQSRMDDEYEADPPSSPFQENVAASPARPPLPPHAALVTSDGGSPLRTIPRLSIASRPSSSPRKSLSQRSSPARSPSTPSKQRPAHIPGPSTPATPEGSPIKPRSRSVSPQKRCTSQINQPPTKPMPVSLFQKNALTGQSTPTFVLKSLNLPSHGISKEGLGSPRVAEILDKRRSIGEDAQEFVLKPTPIRGVKFDDLLKPRTEVEKDIGEDALHRASQESEKDATLNLREMISSLTPKKNKLKGRKSLHVGAARGLLGKRPPELDMDDADEDLTPKRLRGREASPVKSIKLPAPPSKAETVGRPSRLSRHYDRSVSPLINNVSPGKQRSPPKVPIAHTLDDEKLVEEEAKAEEETLPEGMDSPVEAIKLSEFLEMTNIHFMELTTTKRRHTIAPGSPDKQGIETSQGGKVFSFEDRVAAGFCTLPMLELYQHSCRELKSYISEGRRIIRSIEAETYADNPPLFQEYITATPDIRLLMDNQFRNVKAHARLLSKEMWYEWRMKLLEGLKQGLDRHVDEMKQDDVLLSRKEKILARVVPGLAEKHARLEIDSQNLQKVMEEIENCDQEELQDARKKLLAVETELSEQKDKYERARNILDEKNNVLEKGQARKEELLQQIRDAENIKEECRGWDMKEVRVLQVSVLSLEKQTGWAILSAKPGKDAVKGTTLSMRYSGEIRLDFDPEHLWNPLQKLVKEGRRTSQNGDVSPVTLTYSPGGTGSQSSAVKPSPEVSLILNAIRAQVSHSMRLPVSLKLFLGSIEKSWETAKSLREEIRMLAYCGVVTTKAVGPHPFEPTLLKVRCILLGYVKDKNALVGIGQSQGKGEGTRARIDIDFTVKPNNHGKQADSSNIDIDIDVDVSASRVYGFGGCNGSQKPDSRLGDLLVKLMDKSPRRFGNGLWRAVVKSIEEKTFL